MDDRPRVLLLSPDFPPARGGIQTLVHRLAVHAERVRYRIVTLASPGWEEFDRGGPLDVRRVGQGRGGRRAANLRLNARAVLEARRFSPEAVLCAHIAVSPASACVRRLLGVPVVQYLHAEEIRGRPRLAGFAVRQAEAIVAVSTYTRDLALGVGADPARIHRIPNGTDVPASRRARRDPRPTILTVARLESPFKGHDVLARALPAIARRVPEVRWVVVGDGSLRARIEELLREGGVADRVTFTGSVADAERDAWFDRAHVFAMPNRLPEGGVGGEGFGIALLEAAAHGLPVIAGNAAGAVDAVADGETGLLVDPTDPRAIAEAVAALLLDPARAEELGCAGRSRAQQFTWPAVTRRLEDVLLEVARVGR